VKEPAVGGTESSKNRVGGESIGQEVVAIGIGTRVLDDNFAHQIGLISRRTADERCIPRTLMDEDRKSCGEAGDAVDVPALRQTLRQGAEGPIERNRPVVARHEVMR